MSIELYQRIMQRHVQIADAMLDLGELIAAQGQDVNALSSLVEAPQSQPLVATNSTDIRPPYDNMLGEELCDRILRPLTRLGFKVHGPDSVHWGVVQVELANMLDELTAIPTEARPPELAPREQWPEIGHTTALEFVGTDSGLILRGTVDVVCHEKTSENAEADFLALHPFAPGVRTKFAEWPSAKPPGATNAPTLTWDDVSPTCPTGKHALTHGGTPTSPVYYGCNCLPYEGNEIAAVVAPTIPDHVHEVGSCICDRWPTTKDAQSVDNDDPGIIVGIVEPSKDNKPSRAKSELTAAQWANGPHFLAYVSRVEPFKSMPVERQNAWRDEFVKAMPADEVMNRWGKRFSAFCGVASAS